MPPAVPQSLSFNAAPLTEPVDPKAVSAFVREMRARGAGGLDTGTVIGIIIGAVALVVVVPILGSAASHAMHGGSYAFTLPAVVIALLLVGVGIGLFISHRRRRVKRYRLSRFAAANGMSYEDAVKNPPLPGMIFSIGNGRRASELVRGHSPRFVEFGNYQYTVKQGKNSTTYRWGYVAVKLDVPLPNIVLDALGNNGFGTNLPASFRKDQRLSLEGDFDKYFTLYCPAGYETDALYLFTPDIMARFVDNAAELDVEIVDDWMFLYTKREASTLDAATWAWLFGAVGALMVKFDQWARWRDDRLLQEQGEASARAMGQVPAAAQNTAGQNNAGGHALPFAPPAGMLRPPIGVAREGRRLKRGGRWVTVVAIVVIAFVWILPRLLG